MCSQDSGYSSSSSIVVFDDSSNEINNYGTELDQVLTKFEEAVKNEPYYLLEASFPLDSYIIKVGLSPARQFTASVILCQHALKEELFYGRRISIDKFEWSNIINLFSQKMNDFFYVDEFDPVEFQCGDYCKIRQLVLDSIKFLVIEELV
uniref:Uncharacterized protein LOC114347145 n=1 Tax=Diabrotica virgifera virgifera TaxID=50390 RepID=A0A6P7HD25_DIAVI